MLRGCLVCVICNSNSFHSFIFKLYTMIVHTLRMCTVYFVYISWIVYSFLVVLNFCKMLRVCLVCIICNSKSFHSLIFILYKMIIHTLSMCNVYFVHIWLIFAYFLGLFIHQKCLGGVCDFSSFHSFIFKLNMLWLLTYWTCVHPIYCAYFIIFLGLLNLDIITLTPPLECLHCLFVCNL